MLKPVDQKTLQAAVKALKIDVPIYSAVYLANGTVRITTRNGTQIWKPPAKRKTRAKAQAKIKKPS